MSLVQFLVTPHRDTAAVSPFSSCNCHLFTLIGLECNTRYYANYYVRKDNDTGTYHRTYYAHVLRFIHTAEHFFMERQLCELFANMMVTSWYVVYIFLNGPLTRIMKDVCYQLFPNIQFRLF